MSNWALANERATKMACIRWHIVNVTNSNETSNETCLEEIISNVEFDDMENSYNKLEQFEEENIMQTIANIDISILMIKLLITSNNRIFHSSYNNDNFGELVISEKLKILPSLLDSVIGNVFSYDRIYENNYKIINFNFIKPSLTFSHPPENSRLNMQKLTNLCSENNENFQKSLPDVILAFYPGQQKLRKFYELI
ncbi:hypothetical protein C2G38_2209898 [Gigaspora rosea]|uniref:Uncharacterized protein n=1 Tax=Gigaspora rosea TaxID=44941 RepID=A0A397UIJ7_9GLOM|nr:hypothetical protein C2G38_2209898 [Gigaspora rosea]